MIVLGCMRLSTEGRPERDDAAAVLQAAWAVGVRRFDVADAYALDDEDVGHNERLVHEVLPGAVVQTKGGLTRPGGAWVPDGRAKHLRAAIEASVERLGGPLPLYLLHAVDPRTSPATSFRALFRAQKAGLIERVGLCNVTLSQLEEALRLGEVAAVQLALHAFDDRGFRGGVAERCLADGIELQAHSPLGGWRRKRRGHPALVEVARRHGVSPERVALAWLSDLGIVPVVGATQVGSVHDSTQAVVLTDEDRTSLDRGLPAGAPLRQAHVPRARRAPGATDGEVVILMGMPAAGKSTSAEALVARGYERLNRDERGGTLRGLAAVLEERLQQGVRRVVLDNTYGARAERNRVIEVAWGHGLPVRCVWLTTDLAQAQRNAIGRLLSRYGRLPDRAELRVLARDDPQAFGPGVLARFQRTFEPPRDDEGFSAIAARPFVRRGDDVGVPATFVTFAAWDQAREALADEPLVVLVGWSRGRAPRPEAPDVPLFCCEHPPGPPTCWCRPPLPGLVLLAAHTHGIALDRSRLVGVTDADRRLAEAAGVTFVEVGSEAPPR